MAERKTNIGTHDELCDALFNAGEFEDLQSSPDLPAPKSEGEVLLLLLLLLPGLVVWGVGIALLWNCW